MIAVQTTVRAPLEMVWSYWTEPQHIQAWNAASDDWHTPHATNDVRVGGQFTARMEAKDKSVGFDFAGTYTDVVPRARLAYTMGDGRKVEITFDETADGVNVVESFDAEEMNPVEMQRAGWQAILDRFKTYTEAHVRG